MPLVKQFDVHKAKQELKSCPKIVRDYVKLLEEHNQRFLMKDGSNGEPKKKRYSVTHFY